MFAPIRHRALDALSSHMAVGTVLDYHVHNRMRSKGHYHLPPGALSHEICERTSCLARVPGRGSVACMQISRFYPSLVSLQYDLSSTLEPLDVLSLLSQRQASLVKSLCSAAYFLSFSRRSLFD